MASTSKSARLAAQRKVMDEATRRRRARKALESLEQDNFHDDPHADLVMSKKALNLFQDHHPATASATQPKPSSKRKSKTTEYYKQRCVHHDVYFVLVQSSSAFTQSHHSGSVRSQLLL